MPVTIRDVARQLGLSITTVSRALDGYPDVSQATRERVMSVSRQLGYVPNRAARQLRRKRTDTIGYILPSGTPSFSDPFFAGFIPGLANEAARSNFDLLISSFPAGGDAEQEVYQRWVCEKRVDGFVLSQVRQKDWRIRYLSEEHIPFASLERSTDPYDYPSVHIEYLNCVSNLVNHLVGAGHKRIAFIATTDDLSIQTDRYQGYRLGLDVNRFPFDQNLVAQSGPTSTEGYQAAKKLQAFPKPPTAIICTSDESAVGVLRAAYDAHLKVGEDLALVVFDGSQGTQRSQPSLTSVDQPVAEIAHLLVRMLLAEINGASFPERQMVIQPILRFGLSTGKGGLK